MKRIIALTLVLILMLSMTVSVSFAGVPVEPLKPFAYKYADSEANMVEPVVIQERLDLCHYNSFNDIFFFDHVTMYDTVHPDTILAFMNRGGEQDCYIKVMLAEYKEIALGELLKERGVSEQDANFKLKPENINLNSKVYAADLSGSYLYDNGTFGSIYDVDEDRVVILEENAMGALTFPNKKEGTLYKVEFRIYYPDPEDSMSNTSYYPCTLYVRMESDAKSEKEEVKINFADVAETAYYAEPVKWAVTNNITAGTSATTFSPNRTCTRAQILTFLWKTVGCPEPAIGNPFGDITSANYYYKPALWAYENGMVSGNLFAATTPCTRGDSMTYIWKAAGKPVAGNENKFVDVVNGTECADAVAWALEKGITAGTSATTFGTTNTCTRAQIMTFLFKTFVK